MKTKHLIITGIVSSLIFFSARGQVVSPSMLVWKDQPGDILNQFPGWYSTDEAQAIADNVLLWQRANGGWPKNQDMVNISSKESKIIRKNKKTDDTNFDNGATYTQLQFLAMVYELTPIAKYRKSFLEGLDYILEAQYDNGGWPQYYPNFTDYNEASSDLNPNGYTRYVTFNDNAMIGIMELLHDIKTNHARYAFIGEDRQKKVAQALAKGIDCILKTQLTAEGKLAGWCAQYDEKSLEPRWGRHFEPPTLSSHETAGIVQFLMRMDQPSPEITNAIQSAVKWLNEVKLQSANILESTGEEIAGATNDEQKDFTWARYYEFDMEEPVFANDGMMYDTYSALPNAIQSNYQWYSSLPYKLITAEYPRWQKQWKVQNVLIHQ